MTPGVTKTVLKKIILNVWIENGPILKTGPVIELAFRPNSYVNVMKMKVPEAISAKLSKVLQTRIVANSLLTNNEIKYLLAHLKCGINYQ
jgi:hypothetical protein